MRARIETDVPERTNRRERKERKKTRVRVDGAALSGGLSAAPEPLSVDERQRGHQIEVLDLGARMQIPDLMHPQTDADLVASFGCAFESLGKIHREWHSFTMPMPRGRAGFPPPSRGPTPRSGLQAFLHSKGSDGAPACARGSRACLPNAPGPSSGAAIRRR